MRKQRGFTLIELAIVLVVVGFLIGAVMQGQKMYYNARLQRIVSDIQEYAKAFVMYYEQQGMYPGDEDDPNYPSVDTAGIGNHNGLIDPGEAENVWQDLANAMGVVRKNSPVLGGSYIFGNISFYGSANQNYLSVTNIFNKMAQSIDARHDDGSYDSGNIQSSAAYDGSDTLITLYWRI